ncbi:MAG: MBL fold metallo-hydrolase [Christensenellaceae bacterium]|nr:MBL fold metallo-hydrolase [Christensenellaceae bacterium]
MKKFVTVLLILLSLSAAALGESAAEPPVLVDRIADPGAAFSFAEDAELLQIIFPNVWDEDAELILCGGEAMLIDCAKEQHGNRVVALLKQLGITELKYVINSHPHNDHILGLKSIAKAVKIDELLFCFPEKETKHMPVALKTADQYGIPVRWYADEERFQIGGAVIDVWLKGDDNWTLNERSAQMRLQFGERTMLFTGDMMQKTQKRLMEVIDPWLLDIDIFKYPHHGLSLPDDDFLATISPEYVIITNTAGDRTKKVRNYLTKQQIPWATTVPGYVSLTTDGKTWVIERIEMASN